jgi:hypothetical protein
MATWHLEKRARQIDLEQAVRGRSSRRRPCEFVAQGEPLFPDRPRPAKGHPGSKAVCGIVLRNVIDGRFATIVVARADSCKHSFADVVTVKRRECPQRVLRELIVSKKLIVVGKETGPGVQIDP